MNITFDQLVNELDAADAVVVDNDAVTYPSMDINLECRFIELSWETEEGRYEHFIREDEALDNVTVDDGVISVIDTKGDMISIKPLHASLSSVITESKSIDLVGAEAPLNKVYSATSNMAEAAQIMYASHHSELMQTTELGSSEYLAIISRLEANDEAIAATRFAIDRHPDTLIEKGFSAHKIVEVMKQLAVIDQPMISYDIDAVYGHSNLLEADANDEKEFTEEQARAIFMTAYPDIIHMSDSFIRERAAEYIENHPNEFGNGTQSHGISGQSGDANQQYRLDMTQYADSDGMVSDTILSFAFEHGVDDSRVLLSTTIEGEEYELRIVSAFFTDELYSAAGIDAYKANEARIIKAIKDGAGSAPWIEWIDESNNPVGEIKGEISSNARDEIEELTEFLLSPDAPR